MSFPSLIAIKVVYSLMMRGLTQPVSFIYGKYVPILTRCHKAYITSRWINRTPILPAEDSEPPNRNTTCTESTTPNTCGDSPVTNFPTPHSRAPKLGKVLSGGRFHRSSHRSTNSFKPSQGLPTCRQYVSGCRETCSKDKRMVGAEGQWWNTRNAQARTFEICIMIQIYISRR